MALLCMPCSRRSASLAVSLLTTFITGSKEISPDPILCSKRPASLFVSLLTILCTDSKERSLEPRPCSNCWASLLVSLLTILCTDSKERSLEPRPCSKRLASLSVSALTDSMMVEEDSLRVETTSFIASRTTSPCLSRERSLSLFMVAKMGSMESSPSTLRTEMEFKTSRMARNWLSDIREP